MADNEKTSSDETPAAAPGGIVTPPPEETPGPEAPVLRRTGGFVSGLLVAAIIVLGILGIVFVYRAALIDMLNPGAREEANRISALELKLSTLEEAGRQTAATTTGLANDLSRLEVAAKDAGGEGAPDLEAVKSIISALEERLDTFEAVTGESDPMLGSDSNPGQLAQNPGDVTQMKDALTALDARFAAMNRSLEEAGGRIGALEDSAPPENLDDILQNLSPRNELGELSARLAAIESADPGDAARAAVLALAATELARAAATSEPFMAELDAFMVLAPGNTYAAQLQSFAVEGAPTGRALLVEFETTAHAITEATRIREGDGFWNWVVNKLTALFSIRKVGERDGDDWQSVLARAENRIAIADLSAAATEIARLEDPAAQGAAPWLARVKARRQVDALVTGLTAEIFADLLTALESE